MGEVAWFVHCDLAGIWNGVRYTAGVQAEHRVQSVDSGAQWPSLDSQLPCLQDMWPRAGWSHLCVSFAWGSSYQAGDHTASSTMQRAWHREHLIRTHHSYFLATSSLWTISPTPVLSKMSSLLPRSAFAHPKAGGEMIAHVPTPSMALQKTKPNTPLCKIRS